MANEVWLGSGACADNAAASDDVRPDELFSVRLSPVEMRNLHLINDPALAELEVDGAASDEPSNDGLPALGGERPEGAGVSFRRQLHARYSSSVPGELSGTPFGCFRYEPLGGSTARLASYEGDAMHVEVPAKVDGLTVTQLGEGLFRGHDEIESVELPASLRRIGAHAFDECSALRQVSLPEALEAIESFAFAKSGLEAVALPSSVCSLGDKAFFSCRSLRACVVPSGLREVGSEAFAYSGIQRIVLPSSVEHVGFHVFDRTPAQVHAPEGTISFAGNGGRYFVDEKGGLYQGDVLVELMSYASTYAVRAGTRRIAARAFCRNTSIRRVELPQGLRVIGDEAFYGCRNLRHLVLPDSLETIGAMALMGTSLSTLRIGESLRAAGEAAFLVQGKSPLRASMSLAHVEIDPKNRFFYLESGLLCQRGAGEGAGDLCLLYLGPDNVVRIPASVNRIASCAFCGTSNIDELFVHGHLHSVCWEALSTVRAIPVVHVQFPQPVDGYESEDIFVPSLSARYRSMTNLITTDEYGTVFNFPYYDSWIAHVFAAEEFFPAAVRRLMRPVRLSERARELYLGILQRKRKRACRYFAQRGNLDALVYLCESGVLERQDVAEGLDETTAEHQTQATACLLELMRRFGWVAGVDMSL